ncbi:MAG: hypothetical protein LBP76_03510 [Treponema sp.]|jgi:two-component system chemotaxis sensor kinase CheA|nr:hypothetical protein [Treponema sp.]
MSIRLRLILTFSVCLSLAYISIALTVFSFTRKSANETFRAMAANHLERVEERIRTFLEPGIMSVEYLAKLELVRNSRGKLTSYLDTAETTTLRYADHPPYEQRIYDEYIRIHHSNDNFGLVFMANDDGQYAQAPEGHIKNPHYDPRVRSWYTESMEDKAEVTVTAPYLTTGGGMVSSIMVKTYDMDNKPLGLVGIDYSLESLTADLNERRIMKTGYLIMFDKLGRILTNGRNPQYVVLDPDEYPPAVKQMASSADGVFTGLDQSGRKEYAVTHTIDLVGWKLAVVFDESEMLASSYSLLQTIVVTSGIVFLLAFIILTFLARSIVHPLEQLIDISTVISSGKYEKNDKTREELFRKLSVTGAMESRKLARSLSSMLSSLEDRVEEITAMKDNLNEGIFLMNKDYIIQPAYSKALEGILADDELEGKKFTDLLSSSLKAKERSTLEDYFTMILNHSFDAKMLEEINPISEFSYINDRTGDQKTLRSNFRAVDRGHEFFIMGALEDFTAEKELQQQLKAEESKRHEEMSTLFQIVQVDPNVFGDFIEDIEYEFDRINSILKDKKLSAREAMVEIYQSVHAIKSNALILGLDNFSGKVHELETEIKNIHDKEEVSFEDVLHFTLELEKIMKEKDKFRETIGKIQAFRAGFGSGRRQDRYVLIETLTKACEKAALALHKKVKFIVEDIDGIVLEYGPRRIMKEVLTQLVRNAVYHGIESPDERQSRGKDPEGLIRLSIKKADNRIHLKLSDDGKGLDFEKIRRTAASRNMLKNPEDGDKNQLIQVLFLPGFSTADNADVHAGRGIGLNLVKERVRGIGGSIKLQSETGKGTVFNIYIPLDLSQVENKAS